MSPPLPSSLPISSSTLDSRVFFKFKKRRVEEMQVIVSPLCHSLHCSLHSLSPSLTPSPSFSPLLSPSQFTQSVSTFAHQTFVCVTLMHGDCSVQRHHSWATNCIVQSDWIGVSIRVLYISYTFTIIKESPRSICCASDTVSEKTGLWRMTIFFWICSLLPVHALDPWDPWHNWWCHTFDRKQSWARTFSKWNRRSWVGWWNMHSVFN